MSFRERRNADGIFRLVMDCDQLYALDHGGEFKDTTVSSLQLQDLRHFEADPIIQLDARMGGIEVRRDVCLAPDVKDVFHQLSAGSSTLISWIYTDELNVYRDRYP